MSRRVAALLPTFWLVACSSGAAPPRNLVLITVDTLRADRLGCYGSALPLTPNLDRLCAESQRFTRAYAPAPYTLPSLAALMTGLNPESVGVTSNRARLPEGIPTLAVRLRAAGFATGAVVGSAVLTRRRGLDAGFQHYDARLPQREERRRAPERIAAPTTDAALEMLDRLRSAPAARFFLWVHYQDPHGPYTPPTGLRAKFLAWERDAPDGAKQLPLSPNRKGNGSIPSYQYLPSRRDAAFYRAGYDGEVHYVDKELGRLLSALAERGIDADTAIVFTADHGEGLGEGDYWFAHGEHLTEPLVRIPLLIRLPGRPGGVRREPVSLVDLAPTLAALLGLEADAGSAGLNILAPRAVPADRVVYFSTDQPAATARRMAIVKGDYKLVRTYTKTGVRDSLFRLPDETTDLAAVAADVVRRLARDLDAARPPRRRAVEPELSDAEREALRALGYLDEE